MTILRIVPEQSRTLAEDDMFTQAFRTAAKAAFTPVEAQVTVLQHPAAFAANNGADDEIFYDVKMIVTAKQPQQGTVSAFRIVPKRGFQTAGAFSPETAAWDAELVDAFRAAAEAADITADMQAAPIEPGLSYEVSGKMTWRQLNALYQAMGRNNFVPEAEEDTTPSTLQSRASLAYGFSNN